MKNTYKDFPASGEILSVLCCNSKFVTNLEGTYNNTSLYVLSKKVTTLENMLLSGSENSICM